jgi:hypothetical protein
MQVGIAALAWTTAGCRGADLHAPPRQGRREAGCSSDARQIGYPGAAGTGNLSLLNISERHVWRDAVTWSAVSGKSPRPVLVPL